MAGPGTFSSDGGGAIPCNRGGGGAKRPGAFGEGGGGHFGVTLGGGWQGRVPLSFMPYYIYFVVTIHQVHIYLYTGCEPYLGMISSI